MKTGKTGANPARATFLMLAVMAVVIIASAAWAQTTGATDAGTVAAAGGGRSRDWWTNIVPTFVYGIIGIALLTVGFKLFDVVIKHNVETEIFDNKNVAAALLSGAFILSVALVVAATILSP
jgi:putative membrane protein